MTHCPELETMLHQVSNLFVATLYTRLYDFPSLADRTSRIVEQNDISEIGAAKGANKLTGRLPSSRSVWVIHFRHVGMKVKFIDQESSSTLALTGSEI